MAIIAYHFAQDRPLSTINPWVIWCDPISHQMFGGLVVIDHLARRWKFITKESFPQAAKSGNFSDLVILPGAGAFSLYDTESHSDLHTLLERAFLAGMEMAKPGEAAGIFMENLVGRSAV